MQKLASCLGLLLLVSCASTPLADLTASEVSLTQVEQAAYLYASLPLCGTEKPGQLCKTLATEAAIRTAKKTADTALAAAKTSVTAGSVASFQVALNALVAIVPVAVTAATGGQ